jgi:hypothetical protein
MLCPFLIVFFCYYIIMEKSLKKSILKTVTFFNLFDYPLTELEIWKFLYSPKKQYSLSEVRSVLKLNPPNIETYQGFYFLKGQREIIEIKHLRYKESFIKFKKAKRVAKIFSVIPFIQLIAIGNFIPENNTKKESDIDFFIVTKKNRIWVTRAICVALIIILKLRPTKKNKRNKICLTFYTTDQALSFKNLILPKNEGVGDLYLFYWIATLYPLYNIDKTYEKFIKENSWLKNYLPNLLPVIPSQKRRVDSKFKCFILQVFNFNFWEKFTKKIQLKILPSNLKNMANYDTRVILNDSMLKFHDQDSRKEYQNKFITTLQKYEIK